jgi:hypothetical protein
MGSFKASLIMTSINRFGERNESGDGDEDREGQETGLGDNPGASFHFRIMKRRCLMSD